MESDGIVAELAFVDSWVILVQLMLFQVVVRYTADKELHHIALAATTACCNKTVVVGTTAEMLVAPCLASQLQIPFANKGLLVVLLVCCF